MMSSAAQVLVTSFGYGHADPPEADVTLDARRLLHDPHVDPAMREMTGLDETVRRHVLATRGAKAWIEHEAALVRALLGLGRPVTVAFGCAGGRHRSVVMASECARLLTAAGFTVTVEHRDVTKPVIRR
ncbi:RNase adapter RapZ [Nonomuraea sp. NPDC048901]|uniref:RapZ C-terminal domain-containing protein n=1 Tax=Nonomuraea sp. NPDC048901 TaxID=3155627 RepID=UPI0033D767C7